MIPETVSDIKDLSIDDLIKSTAPYGNLNILRFGIRGNEFVINRKMDSIDEKIETYYKHN